MFYENRSTEKLGVAYFGECSRTPEQWAAHFGHKAITGIDDGLSVREVEDMARLAGSFARIASEERHEAVHPLVRDLVNDIAAAHGLPPVDVEKGGPS